MENKTILKPYKDYNGYAYIDKEQNSLVVQIDTHEGDISTNIGLDDNYNLDRLQEVFEFTVDNFLKAKLRWAEEDKLYKK